MIAVAEVASVAPVVATVAEAAPALAEMAAAVFVAPAAAEAVTSQAVEAAAPAVPVAVAVVAPPAAVAPPLTAAPPSLPEAATPIPATPPTEEGERLPSGVQPKLVVVRGQKVNMEFPLFEGHNFIGRADEKPVDIDLEVQEPPDRVWSSRQHAVITFEDSKLVIEDLNSANGTFLNRSKIIPGQKRPLKLDDVIQIGSVQLKVKG
jgi:hypothetical protein